MPIECFPRRNIPLYPFLLKAIYVLENIIRNHLIQATPTTLAVEAANFLRFLRLAVKFVTSCGFLRQVFYLLALWMFLRINRNSPQFNFFWPLACSCGARTSCATSCACIIFGLLGLGHLLWASCYNSNLFQSLERFHCRAARFIFNLPKDMTSADVLQRAQWQTLSIYYKSAIFICFHKAYHDRLPDTLIDLIFKKRATNYSTRSCASLIVPRFNTRYLKDSVAFRGSAIWNAVTNICSTLTKIIPYRDLRLKLKSLVNLMNLVLR